MSGAEISTNKSVVCSVAAKGGIGNKDDAIRPMSCRIAHSPLPSLAQQQQQKILRERERESRRRSRRKGERWGGASPSMFKGRRLLIVVFVDIVCTDVVDNEGLNERQSFSHTTFFHILFSLFLSSLFPLKEKTKRKTLFRFYIPSDLHHCATRVCAFVATTCALYTLSSFFSVLCGYRLSFSLSF